MDNIILGVLDKMSPTHLTLILWAVTLFILYVLFQVGGAVRRFSKNMDKEDRGIELSKQNTELTRQVADINNEQSHFYSAVQSLNSYISNFNSLLNYHTTNRGHFLPEHAEQSLADLHQASSITLLSIHNEISTSNKSRVSYWVYNDETGQLDSIMRSTNFTSNASRDTSRTLDINLSIAGRAFRKKEMQFVSNLNIDPDWSTFSTNQKYESILAVPVADFGVVTIDFSTPPNEIVIELCGLYVKSFEFQIIMYVDEYLSYERYSKRLEEEMNSNEVRDEVEEKDE
ncbi:GAF domain-containing protein [Exiguobacterium mexicanum]|uniref:GAF domain-containing protein n=1 Tax=Exiguobacterium mexicanum TaxID=340146 RepID=UPI00110E46FB|nr:GAF domain-containing protein [Exiguobacterium mexicanum]